MFLGSPPIFFAANMSYNAIRPWLLKRRAPRPVQEAWSGSSPSMFQKRDTPMPLHPLRPQGFGFPQHWQAIPTLWLMCLLCASDVFFQDILCKCKYKHNMRMSTCVRAAPILRGAFGNPRTNTIPWATTNILPMLVVAVVAVVVVARVLVIVSQ